MLSQARRVNYVMTSDIVAGSTSQAPLPGMSVAAGLVSCAPLCCGGVSVRLRIRETLETAEISARSALTRLTEPIFNLPDFTPEHETPVLYVHGIHSRASGFRRNARYLRDHGYWVWGFNYGHMFLPGLYGTGPLEDSLEELRANVDKVLAETGAEQVDIVAHSQGGLLTKLFIAQGGAPKVRRVVAMSANFHGTDLEGRAPQVLERMERFPGLTRALLSPSVPQQLAGSPWMRENADPLPDTDPSVVYTALYSTRDTLVTPNSASMLEPVDGADVVNKEIPGKPIHQLMMRDQEIAELTLWGLERPASPRR